MGTSRFAGVPMQYTRVGPIGPETPSGGWRIALRAPRSRRRGRSPRRARRPRSTPRRGRSRVAGIVGEAARHPLALGRRPSVPRSLSRMKLLLGLPGSTRSLPARRAVQVVGHDADEVRVRLARQQAERVHLSAARCGRCRASRWARRRAARGARGWRSPARRDRSPWRARTGAGAGRRRRCAVGPAHRGAERLLELLVRRALLLDAHLEGQHHRDGADALVASRRARSAGRPRSRGPGASGTRRRVADRCRAGRCRSGSCRAPRARTRRSGRCGSGRRRRRCGRRRRGGPTSQAGSLSTQRMRGLPLGRDRRALEDVQALRRLVPGAGGAGRGAPTGPRGRPAGVWTRLASQSEIGTAKLGIEDLPAGRAAP